MASNLNIPNGLAAVAGIALNEAIDRINLQHLKDGELMGELLLDVLKRRGLTLAYAKFLSFSLDDTTLLPILPSLLVRQAE